MRNRITGNEVIYQIIVHILLFVTLSVSMRDPEIHLGEVLIFINYAIAALLIGFLIVPKFYSDQNLTFLVLSSLIVVLVSILVEELFLEQIFFPDNRGKTLNVLFTVLQIFPKIMMLVGFKIGWDALKMRKEMEKLKDLARQSELQFLQSQINPHFLFNNLNNLYSYAIEGSSRTPEIILELSGILRYMLYECKDDYVSLSKDIEQLENFINLNELQIEDRGKVTFTHSGKEHEYMVAPLILVVFVENAFKHSVSSLSENIDISVDIKVDDNGVLNFDCKNTYADKSNTDSLAHGIGLENVRKRLELIYGNNYDLLCNAENGVYHVILSIKLDKRSI